MRGKKIVGVRRSTFLKPNGRGERNGDIGRKRFRQWDPILPGPIFLLGRELTLEGKGSILLSEETLERVRENSQKRGIFP